MQFENRKGSRYSEGRHHQCHPVLLAADRNRALIEDPQTPQERQLINRNQGLR